MSWAGFAEATWLPPRPALLRTHAVPSATPGTHVRGSARSLATARHRLTARLPAEAARTGPEPPPAAAAAARAG